jgi:hypothetical protein
MEIASETAQKSPDDREYLVGAYQLFPKMQHKFELISIVHTFREGGSGTKKGQSSLEFGLEFLYARCQFFKFIAIRRPPAQYSKLVMYDTVPRLGGRPAHIHRDSYLPKLHRRQNPPIELVRQLELLVPMITFVNISPELSQIHTRNIWQLWT